MNSVAAKRETLMKEPSRIRSVDFGLLAFRRSHRTVLRVCFMAETRTRV